MKSWKKASSLVYITAVTLTCIVITEIEHRAERDIRAAAFIESEIGLGRSKYRHFSVVEGMSFDRGYMSQYMVTDTDKMESDLDNPYILITDKKISNIQDILQWISFILQATQEQTTATEDFGLIIRNAATGTVNN